MNFCLLWKEEKEIMIIGLEWILQKENQSYLKLKNSSQNLVLLGYVSNYSQNSCLSSIPPSSYFGIFNVLLPVLLASPFPCSAWLGTIGMHFGFG